MQTSGISSQEQWARFMQLSQAARVRNQGLTAASSGIRRNEPPRRAGAAATFSPVASGPVPSGSAVSRSYAPVKAATPARILGGAFDAYA